jgi:hypothetical protein
VPLLPGPLDVLVPDGVPEGVPDGLPEGVPEGVLEGVPGLVVVDSGGQGTVGLSLTQSQSALTELRSSKAPGMPHPWMTQSWAALWITADDVHWHWKSSVAHLA